MGTIFILSTLSTSSIEEVAAAAPNTIKWFQLYIYKDSEKLDGIFGKYGLNMDSNHGLVDHCVKALEERSTVQSHGSSQSIGSVTQSLVERAERSGYKALVLTVDSAVFGMRRPDLKNAFSLPSHLRLANFNTNMNVTSGSSGLKEYVNSLYDQAVTWGDITWLKSITKLPIILKGILTAEDAAIGADLGAAAILVSNHGGRQLDGVPATIEALPEIVRAVQGRVEVYLDGGVRGGTDVFKALALGARMVWETPPVGFGPQRTGRGQEGCVSVADIKPSLVTHNSSYSRL
uniref:FMN hydroxy acid dehydrogenase domain-containing protein n=1 Tax=Timema genevievae TaxID=629358 RepID=A0A7R9JUT8_TIMGE|nr:unnamed protein product [Timema genevievae]